MNYNEVIKLIESDGRYQVRQKARHRANKHIEKEGVDYLSSFSR